MDEQEAQPERWEQIGRYLAEESSPEEIEALERWLAEDPVRSEMVAQLRSALEHARPEPVAELDVEAALARVHQRMDAAEVPSVAANEVPAVAGDQVRSGMTADADVAFTAGVRPITTATSARRRQQLGRRLWRSTPLRAAAALLLLLGGQAVYRALRSDDDGRAPAIAARSFETPVGRADTVQLDDGSTVVLAPASRIRVAAGYGRSRRSVTLEGVAWFDVRPDGPDFTVVAGDALVTDLGTAFTVRADPAQPVSVTVTEGLVRLAVNTGTDSGVILRAGQSGTVAGGVARQSDGEPAAATAWTRGRLVFEDAAFPQVAAELRRWYGVQLVAGDSALAARHLTSEFQGEPLEAVIAVVALALDARSETRADTIILHSLR